MYRNFTEIKEALSKGGSVEEILLNYFSEIEKQKELNAYVEVFQESALEQAKSVDHKLREGKAGRLAGMVIGIKDNICYKGHKVSAASQMLENFESIYTSTALQRLIDEDAIIIGRLNCDEFAMGSSNETSFYGPVKNPRNTEYVAGGSSGGSAAAVAANLCTVSLGSDTGGSIRQPASFTGTIGFKPTYGRISRYGVIAYASSFDQLGVFGQTMEDVALVTEIMAGQDKMDNTSSSKEVPVLIPQNLSESLKIAVLGEAIEAIGLDAEVKSRLIEITETLKKEGHTVENISFPYMEQVTATYYVLTVAEASSNLARFDGIHFGYRSPNAEGVEEIYVKSRTEAFGSEVKRRIMAGTFVLSEDYYDAYFRKAQKIRRLMKERIEEIFQSHDIILLPTSPSTAFKLKDTIDPIQLYLQDKYTVIANLTGSPAISLPLGQHSNGMPFGLQLIGKHFEEKGLMTISEYFMEKFSNA